MTTNIHNYELTELDTNPYISLNNQGHEEKFYLTKESYRLGRDPNWSTIPIPKSWTVMSRRQAIITKEGSEYRIQEYRSPDRATDKSTGNGIFLDQARITGGYLLRNGSQLHIGLDPRYQIILTYRNPKSTNAPLPNKRRLDLTGLTEGRIELGRSLNARNYASMQLASPTVSRLHSTVYSDGKGGHVLQDHSSNGTFVNGHRIGKNQLLHRDDTVQIGPYNLIYTGTALELSSTTRNIRLDAHNLSLKVLDKAKDQKTLLDDISLAIEPGQLVALVGGSGSGKSTLMQSLLQINNLDSGEVFLNGDDLRQNWAIYRSQVGYVPQENIIHPNLTVEEVLKYACKLRLPPDTNVKGEVGKILEQVKLTSVSHTLISNISPGQRKCVSIGVELFCDPKLFFLDEPTSGLDPGLEKEMMQLLRELANQNRTIILVTDATANIAVCDRIAVLGLGGQLCYFGPPQEALEFFGVPEGDFADIYIELNQGKTEKAILANVGNWHHKFRQSPQYNSYIRHTLSPGKQQQQSTDTSINTGISAFKQLLLLSQRYWQLIKRDRVSLILALLSGPLTILITAFSLGMGLPVSVGGNHILESLFIFSGISIWIGLSNSIQEISRESAIYFRERLLNLGLIPYIGSKLLIRSGIALVQTILITISILVLFRFSGSTLISWPIGLAITTFLTLIASTSLSLMVSASVKDTNQGISILPLIMIPQIILSGVLFQLDGLSKIVSWFMISRWSVGAYGIIAQVNEIPGATMANNEVYQADWNHLLFNWGILLVHILVYLVITMIVQKRKDIF
ncbi:ABC-type multidrug transport system, ATPase component [Xenococcus sp. PCC 7305]|uniref:ATP-binding cassette domain-containing protein n=1 Tax=Xenococcus sp. PCC 7305 TaxID=102125 RepID=UPI0002AC4791|nr:ATP-binding cassette domain-containing protein [Xenococcus sp. PCC 7305]ELS02633.1 ABC-type multidrug transport system, ATPase component [Xenococcus sp. PCC 7305]